MFIPSFIPLFIYVFIFIYLPNDAFDNKLYIIVTFICLGKCYIPYLHCRVAYLLQMQRCISFFLSPPPQPLVLLWNYYYFCFKLSFEKNLRSWTTHYDVMAG